MSIDVNGLFRVRGGFPNISVHATYLWAVGIFVYFLVYELVFFFYPGAYPLLDQFSKIIKLGFPIILVLVFGRRSYPLIIKDQNASHFLFFFILFLLWAGISSATNSQEALREWLKVIPRFLFFIGTLSFFLSVERGTTIVLQLITLFALASVVQYALLITSGEYHTPEIASWGGAHAGPGGVLGNISSRIYIAGREHIFVRLAGFWNEPSNASAVLFSSFFFARWLGLSRYAHIWNAISWIVLAGGFMCFSNAGYLAFGSALIVGSVFSIDKKLGHIATIPLVLFGLFLVGFAFWGRVIVSEIYSGNKILNAIVGIRNSTDIARSDIEDTYNGRIPLLLSAFEVVSMRPAGIGLVPLGEHGGPDVPISASSLVMWYTMTGLPGLLLLLCRESWVWRICITHARNNIQTRFLCQGYIVIAVQQLSYGSWMNGLYFIAIAAVFVSTYSSFAPSNAHTEL